MHEPAILTRRAAAAALPLAALTPLGFAAGRNADAKLLALGSELGAVHSARIALDDAKDFQDDGLYVRHWELREAINRLPAVTLAGVAVKARAAQTALHYDPFLENEGDGAYRDLTCSLIDDLIEMSKRGRPA